MAAFCKRPVYDDARLVLDALLAARGIAGLPSLLVEGSLASGQLVAVRRGWAPCSDMVSQVFEWLRDALRAPGIHPAKRRV
jgi:DNA-binding transcriptional LysR family regulator